MSPIPAQVDPVVADLAEHRGISLAEAQRRIDWQAHAGDVQEDLRATFDPDRFGGMWIDDATGRLQVGVVKPEAADQSVVDRHAAGHGVPGVVDIVPVRFSEAHLREVGDWLVPPLRQVNEGAKRSMQTAIWARGNVVELRLPGAHPLTVAQQNLVSEAQARHGAAISVTDDAQQVLPTACRGGPFCDPPLRAGIRVPNRGCTLGFLARSKSDNALYAMSAGHCVGRIRETWWTWFAFQDSEEHIIGYVHNARNSVQLGDMAIIRVTNEAGWRPRAWTVVTPSADTVKDDEYTINDDRFGVENTRVCSTGATSATRCGVVSRATMPGELGRSETTYCSAGGDSGGPVFGNHIAYGIHVAATGPGPTCRSYYTQVRYIEAEMNVNVAHDAG